MTALDLQDEIITYWDDDTLIVQNGHGELVIASDVVEEAER